MIWTLVLALHLLAAIVWVGGLFYALVVLRPALAVLEPAPRLQLHMNTLKRFFLIVWHAMPIMLVSGGAMVLHLWHGMAGLPWPINAMQGMAVAMAAIFGFVFFGPWQRLRRAIRPGAEVGARIRLLLGVNLALGLATAVVAVFGQTP